MKVTLLLILTYDHDSCPKNCFFRMIIAVIYGILKLINENILLS